jgi:vacuolar protein 8
MVLLIWGLGHVNGWRGVVLIPLIDVREVERDTLEPILVLLQSPDIEVQRAASAALGNLAVNSKFSESGDLCSSGHRS